MYLGGNVIGRARNAFGLVEVEHKREEGIAGGGGRRLAVGLKLGHLEWLPLALRKSLAPRPLISAFRIASYRGGQTFEWPGGPATGIQNFPSASIQDGRGRWILRPPAPTIANRPDVGMTSVWGCGRPGHLAVQQSSRRAIWRSYVPGAWRSGDQALWRSCRPALQQP